MPTPTPEPAHRPQGQKLDGTDLQEVLDSAANAGDLGEQQFFTPRPNIMEGMRLGGLHPRIGDEGKVKTKAFLGGFVGHPKLLSEVYKKVHF